MKEKGFEVTGLMARRKLWSLVPGVEMEPKCVGHWNERIVVNKNGAHFCDAQDDGKSVSFQLTENPLEREKAELKREIETRRMELQNTRREQEIVRREADLIVREIAVLNLERLEQRLIRWEFNLNERG